MTGWLDTHLHLEDEAFDPDREAVLERALASGVGTLINAGSTPRDNRAAGELCRTIPRLFRTVGFHPHEFPGLPGEEWRSLPAELSAEKVVGVGETGLDYHLFKDFPPPDRKAQEEGFRRQLRLARIFELPLVLHVREAFSDALRILGEEGPFPNGGVMHCYAGGAEYLDAVLGLGLHLGVGGTATYPKAAAVHAAVREAPLERLILETDAPYLPPQPHRGKRNEPAWLVQAGEAAARIRGISTEALAAQTTENALRLFKLREGNPGVMVYDLSGHLYVNLTNRCSADCVFCPRRVNRRVQQYELTLQREPLAAELITAIGNPARYAEIVFCGFGEPTLRLPTLLSVARAVKAQGGRVRVNTNGMADLLYGEDILPQCRGLVDEWSVSLNSADRDQHHRLVRSAAGPGAHDAVIDFIRRAVRQGFMTVVTCVELPEVDARAVADVARALGARFRGRLPQRLGEPENG